MLGGLKVIIRFEFGKVGNVFQTAVSIRRVHGESPVAAGLRRGAHRQPDEHTRGVTAAEFIANKKLFGGPGLGHFFDVGDAGVGVPRMERPASAQEDNHKHEEKSDSEFERRIAGRRWCAERGHARDLRHVRLEAVRWGLIGHKGSALPLYWKPGRYSKREESQC